MTKDITVVLNGFKRPQYFKEQLDAVTNQTNKPSQVMFWQNKGAIFEKSLTDQTIHAESNFNFGVWSRFAYALNAKTEYVCIFDDDTIPGSRWFENCLQTIKIHDGLLGTIGIVLNSNTYPFGGFHRVGWSSANRQTQQVDIVGHSWFFRREWLSHFWRELPSLDSNSLVGEDIHFTAMLQRFAGKNTYVPAHPPEDHSLWGSSAEKAYVYGTDAVAISCTNNQNGSNYSDMNKALNYEISKGFKPMYMRGANV